MKINLKDGLYIGGMVLSWATYFTMSKWAITFTSSVFLAGFLLRLAAFLFLTAYIISKKEVKILFKQGKTTLILFAIGLLGYLLDTFANIGFQHGSVGTGTVLLKTDVLMANIATVIFIKEKLYLSDWIGTFVMMAGVVLILNINYQSFSFNWYDLFFILSALSVTANAFIIKGTQEKKKISSDVIAYYNNFTVMFLFLISALIAGDFANLQGADINFKFILLILLGGLGQSFIYIFYYRNLKRFPVWEVKLFLLFIPIISCFIGVFVFGEKIEWIQFIGICFVLVGAIIILLRSKINKKNIIKVN